MAKLGTLLVAGAVALALAGCTTLVASSPPQTDDDFSTASRAYKDSEEQRQHGWDLRDAQR